MHTNLLSRRYIKALVNTTAETEIIQLLSELTEIITAIENAPSLLSCLKDPSIQKSTKKQFIQKVCSKSNYANRITSFFNYVADKNRLEFLSDIKNEAVQTLNKFNQIVEGVFITPSKIDSSEQPSIQAKLETKFDHKLKLTFETNPDLIGGFQIKFGNIVLDNSIQNKIEKFKQKLNEN